MPYEIKILSDYCLNWIIQFADRPYTFNVASINCRQYDPYNIQYILCISLYKLDSNNSNNKL